MKITRRQITRTQFEAARFSYCGKRDHRNDVYESTAKFQKTFKEWYKKERHQIAILLTIRQKNKKFIQLSFDNYPAAIDACITLGDISVAVTWNGLCIDYLISMDLYKPSYRKNTIICRSCLNGQHQYATLNQFWMEHIFEDFARWVNETLAPAAWLGIYATEDDGITWAKLHKKLPERGDSTVCILELPLDTAAHFSPNH